jgi:hypothetical protein
VFNFKQSTQLYIAENDVWPAIDFKIIPLTRERFELETPDVDREVAALLSALGFSGLKQ